MKFVRFFLLLSVIFIVSCSNPEYIGRIMLENTDNYLPQTPVQFQFFDEKAVGQHINIHKPSQSSNEVIPVQIDNYAANFILPEAWDELSDGYYLSTCEEEKINSNLQLTDDDSTLTLLLNNKPVLSYVHAKTNVPARDDSIYARSGFVHPLWAPNGAVLTNIHPDDHLHHLGLWHPWTKVTFKGREIDFWNLGKGEGTVDHAGFLSKETGPVFAGFTAEHIYFELNKNGTNKPVLNELVKIKLWDISPGNGFLLDYTITQNCAVHDSVRLEQYRYGGFGFRASLEWSGSNRNYLTSEGDDIITADGSRARWCLVWGNTPQGICTILFMSHPDNREHPEPLRIWGEWTEDTFFNFCPIKQKSITLYPEESYIQKFRIYTTDGIVQARDAEAMWRAFANPPKVKYVTL